LTKSPEAVTAPQLNCAGNCTGEVVLKARKACESHIVALAVAGHISNTAVQHHH